ncbi:hypothetical protein N6L24_06815 [Cognatishimia sp. SS12]|uniref:hypothetical protein n=1 Tax=Cognatishimia sp. SS12 TaxID=2979465 RepID=UPI00233016F8|nr:hypothetical protein [Cognatishimia sp. SS12]MDC0737984.1 hypothetical protein [Cognatishimia sp. SS12]
MRGVALWFVGLGTVFLLLGMVWGIQMSATQNHILSPAHAHLNLVGFVLMSVFGLFYHTVPAAADKALAKLHFALSAGAVIIMIPGIVMAINQTGETLAKLGSVLAVLSGLAFLAVIVTSRSRV